MVEAICLELKSRNLENASPSIETIYFGGGTPSLLSSSEISVIIETIYKHFNVGNDAEITLEANPDDLTTAKLKELRTSQVNRLSIGIQSFRDQDLKFMNRAHNAQEADRCVKTAQDIGFENITIDLIYAIPGLEKTNWIKNITTALGLNVPHISSYCMTIEEKTVFGNREKKGLLKPTEDDHALEQYILLSSMLRENEYSHYEVSNFAKKGFESKHNTSYWSGKPYLGVGPSAHSFDGISTRRWNISNNAVYLKKIYDNEKYFESELLNSSERYNETVMTSLRTAKGIDTDQVKALFGIDIKKEFSQEISEYQSVGWLISEAKGIRLTEEGFFRGDTIASDFFKVQEK